MIPKHEELYLKASGLARELQNAFTQIDDKASFVVIAGMKGKSDFGSAFIGGNKDLLINSIANMCAKSDAVLFAFIDAVTAVMEAKNGGRK